MGVFSWITSDTHKSIAMNMNGYKGCPKRVYLLNPFGDPYAEDDYEGYGMFGGRDVYALVAIWNCPEKCKNEQGEWYPDDVIRNIGITLACYDEDHVKLRYPIKIVEKPVPYDSANISPNCPYQGCFYGSFDNEYNEKIYDESDEEIQNALYCLEKAQEAYIHTIMSTEELCVEVRIEGGYFRIDKSSDPNYPGIDIEFIADNESDGLSRPRILFEKTEDGCLRALIWNNPNQEDFAEEIQFNLRTKE